MLLLQYDARIGSQLYELVRTVAAADIMYKYLVPSYTKKSISGTCQAHALPIQAHVQVSDPLEPSLVRDPAAWPPAATSLYRTSASAR
jgi:hypothetical protein